MTNDSTLKTTQREFEELHASVEKSRADVNYIMVNKKTIKHILFDHSDMIRQLENNG